MKNIILDRSCNIELSLSPNHVDSSYPAVCVKLLSETNQWQKLLQLIVDLNDITLLTGAHGEGEITFLSCTVDSVITFFFQFVWSGADATNHNSSILFVI